jgi:hypothetical protein
MEDLQLKKLLSEQQGNPARDEKIFARLVVSEGDVVRLPR